MPQTRTRRKAAFLDRDGVINRTIFRDGKPRAPDRVEDFEIFPDVKPAIKKLKASGFLVLVVTNQPDVARGWQTLENVESMNRIVREVLKVDDIRVCYHLDADHCECRKPKPGMLIQAASDLGIDLSQSFMVGDRDVDIQAGKTAGCRTILVKYENASDVPSQARPDAIVGSLGQAVEWMIATGKKDRAA